MADASHGASWGGRPHPFLVECGLIGACVVGVWVTVKLLEQFSSSLKPFVLAMLFVGCLEACVQFLENGMIQCWKTPDKFLHRIFDRAMTLPSEKAKKYKAKLSRRFPRAGSLVARLLDREEDFDAHLNHREPSKMVRVGTSEWSYSKAGQQFIPRLIAVLITLTITAYILWNMGVIMVSSVNSLPREVYAATLANATHDVQKYLQNHTLVLGTCNQSCLSHKAQSFVGTAESYGTSFLQSTASDLSSIGMETVMFLLYSMLMLLQPLPEGEQLFKIVRTYFVVKTTLNTLLGVCVYALLTWWKIDLALLMGLISGFLSFLPEVGFFVSMALPVPLVMLNGALGDVVKRLWILLWVELGMLLIKTIVSNVLESAAMGKNKVLAGVLDEGENAGHFVETHSAIVLLAVIVWGEIWGPIGMLISVPLISVVRLVINVGTKLEVRKVEITRQKTASLKDMHDRTESRASDASPRQMTQKLGPTHWGMTTELSSDEVPESFSPHGQHRDAA